MFGLGRRYEAKGVGLEGVGWRVSRRECRDRVSWARGRWSGVCRGPDLLCPPRVHQVECRDENNKVLGQVRGAKGTSGWEEECRRGGRRDGGRRG